MRDTLSRFGEVRATLFRLDAEEHVLLLSMHHIVADDWSMGIFSRELQALYEAFVTNQEPQLPELPIQYADYALWQHAWSQNGTLEKQLQYWKQQLAGAPPLLNLPTDHRRTSLSRCAPEANVAAGASRSPRHAQPT